MLTQSFVSELTGVWKKLPWESRQGRCCRSWGKMPTLWLNPSPIRAPRGQRVYPNPLLSPQLVLEHLRPCNYSNIISKAQSERQKQTSPEELSPQTQRPPARAVSISPVSTGSPLEGCFEAVCISSQHTERSQQPSPVRPRNPGLGQPEWSPQPAPAQHGGDNPLWPG